MATFDLVFRGACEVVSTRQTVWREEGRREQASGERRGRQSGRGARARPRRRWHGGARLGHCRRASGTPRCSRRCRDSRPSGRSPTPTSCARRTASCAQPATTRTLPGRARPSRRSRPPTTRGSIASTSSLTSRQRRRAAWACAGARRGRCEKAADSSRVACVDATRRARTRTCGGAGARALSSARTSFTFSTARPPSTRRRSSSCAAASAALRVLPRHGAGKRAEPRGEAVAGRGS